MKQPARPIPPAFYAPSAGRRRSVAGDWWLLLHPPYTMWHLSYVAIGAALAPRFDGGILVATLLAFLLAVGIGAHALDELHDRPLGTAISSRHLAVAAALSIGLAVALGVVGVARVGAGLALFIVLGVALNCAYNLELLGGRFHTDQVFAAAWGAFPLVTAYYAQAGTLGVAALAGAAGAYGLSRAQRALSTPARALRRRVGSVDGALVDRSGHTTPITRQMLLTPLETALRAMAWAIAAVALALVVFRVGAR